MNPFFGLLSVLYGLGVGLRNFLFDVGIFRVSKFPVDVVSVGNISVGGTGKTPLIHSLARNLKSRGRHPVILSRGYGRQGSGIERVRIHEKNGAKLFGDEPFWLARENPEIPVYVGASRVRAMKQILEREKADIVLLDDGFQHRWLARTQDWVLIDLSQPLSQYRLLPLGRLREPVSSLKRATAVFFTKCNIANPETKQFFQKNLSRPSVEVSFVIEEVRNLRTGEKRSAPKVPALAVCAIGNPKAFKKTLENSEFFSPVEMLAFPDHHVFTAQDWSLVEETAKRHRVQDIVVSEKDVDKIDSLASASQFAVWNTVLKLKVNTPWQDLL